MNATIYCDLDGCVWKHEMSTILGFQKNPELLPGVKDKFKKWMEENNFIILTTGRKESSRAYTIQQLYNAGLPYDVIVFGLGRGPRIVINDLHPDSPEPRAVAVNLVRDQGFNDTF